VNYGNLNNNKSFIRCLNIALMQTESNRLIETNMFSYHF
jgi:hypothetical protein